jgi:putative NADH-flavin reductase
MKIALVGATGFVGSHVLRELAAREHDVTAIARYVEGLASHPRISYRRADIAGAAATADVLRGHDAVVTALPFRTTSTDRVLATIRLAGVSRLLVVGGAGSLRTPSGQRVVDQPDFPAEYRDEALAGCAFLEQLCAEAALSWTFLSPSAILHDGPRTGRYRTGQDDLLVAADGQSHISVSDYAIALVDELERPAHLRQRFTVGY